MSRRSRTLTYLATLAVVVGVGVLHASLIGHYRFVDGSRLGWDVAYSVVLGVTTYAAGLPDQVWSRGGALLQAVVAVGAAAAVISFVQLAAGSLLLPRLVVAASALVLTPVYLGCGELSRREADRRRKRERLLVVAGPDDVAMLMDDLRETREHAACVVESATTDRMRGRGTEQQPLIELAEECRPTVVVLDRRAAADDAIVAQAAVLHEQGVRVRTLSLFYEEWMGKLPLGELERVSLMFDIGELHRARYGRVKRLMDIAVSIFGSTAAALAIPVVWIVDIVSNPGPLFYRQERIGKGGRTFTIVKFRTCQPGSDSSYWTLEDDPRVTRGGAWLRRLHIDELPNFINVLRGDMTLVGPRPEQAMYVEELSSKLPFYALRHLVRPGMTGWAQVNYGYAADHSGALQKLQYDFYYLRRQSLLMDLRVLGRTLRAVLRSGR